MSKSPFLMSLQNLALWFERQKRVLPWRDEPTLYRVWVSEIMLQQTQVVTVVPYFERFIARFPSVEVLAASPEADVLLHWAGLGYYSRARNLHRAAQKIVLAGGFPRDRAGWLEMPGVGEYTAGAILSIALNLPEPILDGNVERVLSRLRRVGRGRGDSFYKERLWRLSRVFVSRAFALRIQPGVLNQALMELGATVCTPRKPRCSECPIESFCRARAVGDQENFPPKKKPKKWVHIEESLHCVIDERGRVLLRKRASGEWRAGLWDLLEQPPVGARFLGEVHTKHVVTRHKIARATSVWRARVGLSAAERGSEDERWVSVSEPEVALGSALKRVLEVCREQGYVG